MLPSLQGLRAPNDGAGTRLHLADLVQAKWLIANGQ
jgi:hypothetical protein